jgi:hypothetical protein
MPASHESVPNHYCSLKKQHLYHYRRTDNVNIRYQNNIFTGVPQNAGVWTAIAKPYTPNIINLSWYIGSISSRPLLEKQRSVRITDGKANPLVSWGSLPHRQRCRYKCKIGLCINLSFDRKVMLRVKVIYIYILWPPLIPLINITLGLYILSTILNDTNVVFTKYFIGQIYTKNIFKANHISRVHLLALIPAVAEPTWIIPAQVRESIPEGSNVLQTV